MLQRLLALLLVSSAIVNAQSPAAWPQWRGPARDGVASAFTVPATWPAQLTKKWSATVGVGHASPVVSGNRVVVHTRQDNREIVAAYDLASGKQLWQDGVDAPYTMNSAATGHGPGPKSTPADRRWTRVHARHQRHLLRSRSRHRQAFVAEERAADAARVRHGDLANGGRRECDRVPGRPFDSAESAGGLRFAQARDRRRARSPRWMPRPAP